MFEECGSPRFRMGILGLTLAASVATAAPLQLIENGGFESGSFTGWTATSQGTGPCSSDWSVDSSGAATQCDGFFPIPTGFTDPVQGTYAAYNSFDGPGPLTYQLSQQITLPTQVLGAQLTWIEAVGFGDAGIGGAPRDFRIELFDSSGLLLIETLWLESFVPGPISPFFDDWTAHSIDLTALLAAHAGQTLRIAFSNVVPEDLTGPASFGLDAVSLTVETGRTHPTPEPASLWMLATGLLALAAARRRRA